jgi:hypothetical protein
MLYYNKIGRSAALTLVPIAMAHLHPHPTVSGSILRLSVWQRLAGAAALSAVLWLVILWAMNP